MKKIISSITPEFVKKMYRGLRFNFSLWMNYLYDLSRFTQWSATRTHNVTREQFRSLLIRGYHHIEKGLSFRDCRVGFGLPHIQNLITYIRLYVYKFGIDETVLTAVSVFQAYQEFNRKHAFENENLNKAMIEFSAYGAVDSQQSLGGVISVNRNDIWSAAKQNLEPFFESRYSVRDFTEEEVSPDLIKKAVAMAQKTPSVCNRQAFRAYLYSSKEACVRVLSCQSGNRGFGDRVNKVIAVTANIEKFASIGERNQCWIDGGMFAMSLLYALHSLGLGTCCLNWSVEMEADRKLRKVGDISKSDAIIMLIAIGHLPETFKVAKSTRKRLDEVLFIK